MKIKLHFWVAIILLSGPLITVPALMDERYWFIEGAASLNFAAANIPEYAFSFQQPGRFMPLSGVLRAVHSYIGFQTMTSFGISLQSFEAITHAIFLFLLFLALVWYLSNSNVWTKSGWERLGKGKALNLAGITFLIFVGAANVRWSHNGLIAYVPMTYLPLISALVFATISREIFRFDKKHGKKTSRLYLLLLATLLSAWANLFYELAYIAVISVVITLTIEYFQGTRNKYMLTKFLSHIATYLIFFLVLWIPIRYLMAMECLQVTCYEGSRLSISGAPKTFILNLVNPLPMVGGAGEIYSGTIRNGLNYFSIFAITLIALFGSIALHKQIFNDRAQSNAFVNSDIPNIAVRGPKWSLFSLAIMPLVVGIVAAGIMSVSERSQRIVSLGDPYRAAPTTWLGYSLAIAIGVSLLGKRSRKTKIFSFGLIAVVLFSQQLSSYYNVKLLQRENVVVQKVYDEVIYPDYSEAGNARRCALTELGRSNSSFNSLFVAPSEKYYAMVLKFDYCTL